jgi:hypothetical protein
MIQSQKGFFFTIFAASVLLSTLLILSFVAFVFKFGFSQPDPYSSIPNYTLIS